MALITSMEKTSRSNHWHKTDAHYLYTVEGHWLYFECDPSDNLDTVVPVEVHDGEMVYTPPMRLHRCTFLTDTMLFSFSKLTRTHENHEADVVRVGG